MMRTLRWTATATALVVCAVVHAGAAGAQPVFGPSQDPVAGSQLFEQKGCAKCHAINGVGGKIGPDLAKIQKPRTFYDLAAAMWNHLPRMAERMKGFGIAFPSTAAKTGAGPSPSSDMNSSQSRILNYAGGAAVVLLLMMYFSKSQLMRLLGLCLLVTLGVATPILLYVSDDGPMTSMKGRATAVGQAQQDRLKQVGP